LAAPLLADAGLTLAPDACALGYYMPYSNNVPKQENFDECSWNGRACIPSTIGIDAGCSNVSCMGPTGAQADPDGGCLAAFGDWEGGIPCYLLSIYSGENYYQCDTHADGGSCIAVPAVCQNLSLLIWSNDGGGTIACEDTNGKCGTGHPFPCCSGSCNTSTNKCNCEGSGAFCEYNTECCNPLSCTNHKCQ